MLFCQHLVEEDTDGPDVLVEVWVGWLLAGELWGGIADLSMELLLTLSQFLGVA
jgi:hypothetical protein